MVVIMRVMYVRKPPRYDVQSAQTAWVFLPWALIFHLVAAVFMFGNPSVVAPEIFAKKITNNEGWKSSLVSNPGDDAFCISFD